MTDNSKRLLLGGLIAVEVVSAALAWRDLGHRSDDQVRGRKKAWRAFIVLNPGNSSFYWILGRRPLATVELPHRSGCSQLRAEY
jgi:hypothetical protein